MRFPLSIIVWVVALASAASGQFISRDYYPLWGEAYENYGSIGYRDALQPILGSGGSGTRDTAPVDGFALERDRRQYDPFGNYLADGLDVFRLQEFRGIAPSRGSLLFESDLSNSLFQNLMIASDEFGGWSNRVLIGHAIRTKFTSMTLNMSRFTGIRWDGATRRNRFTVLGSRISNPTPRSEAVGAERHSAYLFGGRWENTVGDLLTMGLSYVTTFRSDATRRKGGRIQRGVVPVDLGGGGGVEELYVIFSDDSPEDGSGAQVHGLEVYIDGARSNLQPEAVLIPEIHTYTRSSRAVIDKMPLRTQFLSYVRADGPWLPAALSHNTSIGPLARLETILRQRGSDDRTKNPRHGPPPEPVVLIEGHPLEASGTDVLVFKYLIPPAARQVQFRALVANDYSINVATSIGHWADWHNVRRAAGKVRDRSNLGWVSFDYGFPTGLATYGTDVELDILGAKIQGEVVNNVGYYTYPGISGAWHKQSTRAYLVNASRRFSSDHLGVAHVGAELFDLPSTYRTSFEALDPGSRSAVPKLYQLVEDNDDQDEWPDIQDPDGVFPGLDEDGDGIIDTNVNDNQVPDYFEPFLMYYVDPDGYTYGDDFDNNGTVDARQDDNRPDYPYDLDRRGRHLFTRLELTPALQNTVGWYRVKSVTGGGRNRVLYSKLRYGIGREGLGSLDVHYRIKRVKDTIPADIQGGFLQLPGFVTEGTIQPDPLSTRNSLINLLFLEAMFTGIPNLELATKFRYEINARRRIEFEDGTNQEKSQDRSRALVTRGSYKWKLGHLTVMPMFKFRTEHKLVPSSGRRPLLHTRHLIPILRMDYALTSGNLVRAGIQGFPRLKERYRNVAWPFAAYDATSQVLLFQNQGNYSGYDVSLNLGFRRTSGTFWTTLSRQSRSSREVFLQLYFE